MTSRDIFILKMTINMSRDNDTEGKGCDVVQVAFTQVGGEFQGPHIQHSPWKLGFLTGREARTMGSRALGPWGPGSPATTGQQGDLASSIHRKEFGP